MACEHEFHPIHQHQPICPQIQDKQLRPFNPPAQWDAPTEPVLIINTHHMIPHCLGRFRGTIKIDTFNTGRNSSNPLHMLPGQNIATEKNVMKRRKIFLTAICSAVTLCQNLAQRRRHVRNRYLLLPHPMPEPLRYQHPPLVPECIASPPPKAV